MEFSRNGTYAAHFNESRQLGVTLRDLEAAISALQESPDYWGPPVLKEVELPRTPSGNAY